MTRILTAILAISMTVIWAGGCQEEQASSGEKKVRLLEAENKDLQTQLQSENKMRDDETTKLKADAKRQSDEIKKLKTQLQEEITKRENEEKDLVAEFQVEMNKRSGIIDEIRKQLGECAQTNDDKIKAEADKQCKDSISAINDWNTELKEEVDRLKAELAKVKGEEKK